MVSGRSDVLERAMGYPYPMPPRPFVQLGHRTLDPDQVEIDWRGRLPLLAYGSNGAPVVLARKLARSHEPVLVLPARLRDFDVVYSAHISPYGAVPGTLQRSPGTTVRVSVLHLTPEQVPLIAATEPNYEAATLAAVDCRLADGETLETVSAYLSRHGCLLAAGSEVALSAVEADGRKFAAMSEPQVLEHVRATLCPGESIEAFVLGSVTDPVLARSRSAQLPSGPASLP